LHQGRLHAPAGLPVENAKTDAIFERLALATHSKTDAALARALGVTPQSVSDARKKNKAPPAWAMVIAEKYQVSLDWLIFGKEPEFSGDGLAPGQAEKAGKGALEAKIAGLEAESAALKAALAAKQEALDAYKELLKITRANAHLLEALGPAAPAGATPSAPSVLWTSPANE
jgi:hypothetical protein